MARTKKLIKARKEPKTFKGQMRKSGDGRKTVNQRNLGNHSRGTSLVRRS